MRIAVDIDSTLHHYWDVLSEVSVRRFGVELPVVERMLAEYAELVARGYGDEDISATFRLKEELFERTNIMGVPPLRPPPPRTP